MKHVISSIGNIFLTWISGLEFNATILGICFAAQTYLNSDYLAQ